MLTPQPWHWWVLGGILIVLEAMLPGFVLLWLGIAAFGTGAIAWVLPELTLAHQLLAFAGLSLLLVVAWFGWAGNRRHDEVKSTLNRRAEHLVGQTFELVTPIRHGRGRVRIGDSLWTVHGPPLPQGAAVTILSTDGNVLNVAPAADKAVSGGR